MKNLKVYNEYIKSLNEKVRVNKVYGFKNWLYESSIGDPLRDKVIAMSQKEVSEKADRVMQLSIQKIYNYYPYFRPFLNIMPPTPKFEAGSGGGGMGTMSTSGSAIYYCPRFVLYTYLKGKSDFASEMQSQGNLKPFARIKKGLRDPSDYCTFVIIHEIMHNSLKHFLRQMGKSEHLSDYELHQLWNIATDYEINHILKRDPRTSLVKIFPGCVDAEDDSNEMFYVDPSETDEDGNNLQEFFMTSRAEKIFWRLVQNIEKKIEEEKGDEDEDQDDEGDCTGGDCEGDGEGSGEGDGEGSGEGDDGGEDGDSDGGDSEASISVGDIIWDNTSGTYGKVTNKTGDNIEYDEMSEEDAMGQLGIDNNPGDDKLSSLKNMLNDL